MYVCWLTLILCDVCPLDGEEQVAASLLDEANSVVHVGGNLVTNVDKIVSIGCLFDVFSLLRKLDIDLV